MELLKLNFLPKIFGNSVSPANLTAQTKKQRQIDSHLAMNRLLSQDYFSEWLNNMTMNKQIF